MGKRKNGARTEGGGHCAADESNVQHEMRVCGLKKPELLVKGCLDLQNTRNLKPQTMLSYLSTFLLFVVYCYLAKEINISQNEEARMKSAIRDTRRAFGPSAAEDYRKTADEMRGRVPCSASVRERYRQILRILEANLINNELPYRKQQVFNFFWLQGRINTRFVFSKINQSININNEIVRKFKSHQKENLPPNPEM